MSTHTATPPIAFSSDDLDRAHAEWGCNCGPAALAACLNRTPDDIRPHLGDFERRGYMNVPGMRAAIRSAGAILQPKPAGQIAHGLIRIQFTGPWMAPGVPPAAACRYTHWVAAQTFGGLNWIFDVNGGWQVEDEWKDAIVPRLIESYRRADGGVAWDALLGGRPARIGYPRGGCPSRPQNLAGNLRLPR
jgi:hypothetical protein